LNEIVFEEIILGDNFSDWSLELEFVLTTPKSP